MKPKPFCALWNFTLPVIIEIVLSRSQCSPPRAEQSRGLEDRSSMFGGLIVRLIISEGETATRSGQMSIPRYRPTIGFLQRSGSYHRRGLASLERRLKRLGCSPVGF